MPFKKKLIGILPAPAIIAYHFAIAWIAALYYNFPSQKITVIAITGTKGKSSTVEYVNAILEAAGMQTALSSTIRFKIGSDSRPNLRRQTQPGRFFLQRFLAQAVKKGCTVAIIEMTSEGARQYRHRFISLNALIFLNLAPEHIESHGSLKAYADAKFELAKQLLRSRKRPRIMVANAMDPESNRYVTLPLESVIPFALKSVEPWSTSEHGGSFTLEGTQVTVALPGEFSLLNALAAASLARALEIPLSTIVKGISAVTSIPGRAQEIVAGQEFPIVIDYAHTPDSLRAIYAAYGTRRRICILGSTGGGRDLWKRPVMGSIADEMCDVIILTNEDPYDEDPRSIVDGIAQGITKHTPDIIMDRREAIRHALSLARASDVVLITGKGTDPTIQGARGTSIPWNDATVTREELEKIRGTQSL